MSFCGCGSKLLLPVVEPDGPIRLDGAASANVGRPVLEVCPVFAVRQGERLAVYRVRLDDPKAAAEAMAGIVPPEDPPAGFAIVLEPAQDERFAWSAGDDVPARMTIAVRTLDRRLVSSPVAIRLVLDHRLTRKVSRFAGELTPIIGMLTPLGLCFEIFHLTPVTGGWMLWTTCTGWCLPFFSCQCWSFGMKRWSTFCGWWVPCFCK